MHTLHSARVYGKVSTFPNYMDRSMAQEMDYHHEKVVMPSSPKSIDDDDDKELAALRLAALKSLRTKAACSTRKTSVAVVEPQEPTPIYSTRPQYVVNTSRLSRRNSCHPYKPAGQNGNFVMQNVYHSSHVNRNLIEIIPVDEAVANDIITRQSTPDPMDDSKVKSIDDQCIGSELEKDHEKVASEKVCDESEKSCENKSDESAEENLPKIHNENRLEKKEDAEDDDDILLMADLEEEDSLERLISEMDKELNMPDEKKNKETKESSKSQECNNKSSRSPSIETVLDQPTKDITRSLSPYKNISLSPKLKSRRKSQRRSPSRQLRKAEKETVTVRTSKKSPTRYLGSRARLVRSPKRSLNRSPIRRSSRPRSRSPKHFRSLRFFKRTRSPLRSSPASPRRSPWSSPFNSPQLSPRRRRSPTKDKKQPSPSEEHAIYRKRKSNSPVRKNMSPDMSTSRETQLPSSNVVCEAKKRKLELEEPINSVDSNKIIKLSTKGDDNTNGRDIQMNSPKQKLEDFILEDGKIVNNELAIPQDCDVDNLEHIYNGTSSSPTLAVETASSVKIEKEEIKKKRKQDQEIYQIGKLKDSTLSGKIVKKLRNSKKKEGTPETTEQRLSETYGKQIHEETDLRTELSRRRAARINRAPPVQSARLLQSAFKGVVDELKVIQKQKEVRRVTLLNKPFSSTATDLQNPHGNVHVKVPVKCRLGLNKITQETRQSRSSRNASKQQNWKLNHHSHVSLYDRRL